MVLSITGFKESLDLADEAVLGESSGLHFGDAPGGKVGHIGHAFGIDTCEVGTDKNIGKASERVVGLRWFGVCNIKTCGGDVSGIEGIDEVRFVDKSAASGIDDDDPFLHELNGFSPDQSDGLRCNGNVEAADIGIGKEFGEADKWDIRAKG